MTQHTAIAKGTFHVYRPIAKGGGALCAGNAAPAHSQPSDNGGGGVIFRRFWTFFQVSKISVLSGSLRKTSIFKITMADDVTLWSKLESTW